MGSVFRHVCIVHSCPASILGEDGAGHIQGANGGRTVIRADELRKRVNAQLQSLKHFGLLVFKPEKVTIERHIIEGHRAFGVGHVLNGEDEAAANEFSGWAARRLGATLQQAMAGVVNEQAKPAIEPGWRKAS